MSTRRIIIIGCGPAGLAAGYELSKRGEQVVCLEKDNIVGGISRTICRNGFRFDIGGHRFFTKIDSVNELWHEVLGDDFLRRPRLSRIYYNNKFFNYPLKPTNALFGLGFLNSIGILASFIAGKIKPHPKEKTFEQWVSNRFGKKLYRIFFKTYTEKVWGIPCSEIQAEWAAQRIKGLSLSSAVKTALFGDKQKKIKTLIQEFDYPRLGPGQMYETMAEKIRQMGGKVLLGQNVAEVSSGNNRIVSVTTQTQDGQRDVIEGTDFISSMPINELALAIQPGSTEKVTDTAKKLSYRSLLTVNLMMNQKECFPDTWIYIHSPEVQIGRVQCFKNWSPYMVPDENQSSLGLEYFCSEGDALWSMPDSALIELSKKEIKRLGLVNPDIVFDAFVVRMPKTYPVYSMDYRKHLAILRQYLEGFQNLQCIGRNGLFKYNNMDHSILSAQLAVDNLFGADNDIWAVNTEQDYHEQTKVKNAS